MIDMRELYWAAGFLEGEGSFITRSNTNSVVVTAVQKEKEPLERLQRLFSCGSMRKDKSCWVWAVSSYQALGIAMTLWPLMSTRRQVAIEKMILVSKRTKYVHIPQQLRVYCKRGHKLSEVGYYRGNKAECRVCAIERVRVSRERRCAA